MKSVTIPIDDEVFFVLKKDIGNIQSDIKTLLALHYFKEKQLGLGLSAKIADMSKDDFTVFLGKNGIDIYRYTDEELSQEFDLIDRISEGLD